MNQIGQRYRVRKLPTKPGKFIIVDRVNMADFSMYYHHKVWEWQDFLVCGSGKYHFDSHAEALAYVQVMER